MKSVFSDYVSSFDESNLQVANKIRHTWHVAANGERVAASLDADPDLAWLIGVLHDIGRFEQIRVVRGYDDGKGLDHGDYGARLLFEENFIRDFVSNPSADSVIENAVKYHNKYSLPAALKSEESLYCNIVRDADKIDNFRGFHENDFYSFHERTEEEVQSSLISDEILDCFLRHETIPFRLIRSAADFFLIPYALYFGLVFPASRELTEEQGNYRRMLDYAFRNPENSAKFEVIRQAITAYRETCRSSPCPTDA